MEMQRGVVYSGGIHLILLMLAYVGMPDWFHREIEAQPLVITLEDLPITDKTNVKPSDKPIIREKKPPAPKPKPKPTPPVSKPKPRPPAPKPEPVKEPVKDKPDKKPEKPKDKPKPTPPQDDALDEVLKDLKEQARDPDGDKDKKPKKDPGPAQNLTRSDAPYDPTQPLSLSERDAITSQFIQCWRVPAGAANDYTLVVSVEVSLRADGSVIKATLTSDQRGRYGSDTVFRAAADSALRAVQMCSPLKNLPANKYSRWKEMRLNFDPKMQLY